MAGKKSVVSYLSRHPSVVIYGSVAIRQSTSLAGVIAFQQAEAVAAHPAVFHSAEEEEAFHSAAAAARHPAAFHSAEAAGAAAPQRASAAEGSFQWTTSPEGPTP